MSILYAVLDTLLPFEWASYAFMKNALLAMLLITPLFGVLGTMAVDNKICLLYTSRSPEGFAPLPGTWLHRHLSISSMRSMKRSACFSSQPGR